MTDNLTITEITKRLENGETQSKIAKDYNVHPATVGKWLKEAGIPRRKRYGTAEREAAVTLLRAEGAKTRAIAEALGISEGSVSRIDGRVRNGQKNDFLTVDRVKKAETVVDALLEGKTIGEVKSIKDSTVLAAANVVLDREYPKHTEQGGPSVSFTQINLSVVRGDTTGCG